VILFVAIVGAGYFSVRWYNTNSYFVGLNGNELVIYQGRIGGFLWYHPVEVQRTGVTTTDVRPTYLSALQAGVEESTIGNARNYVKNLVSDHTSTNSPPSTLPPASSATTTPVPGAGLGGT
jgi:hypothetical protein